MSDANEPRERSGEERGPRERACRGDRRGEAPRIEIEVERYELSESRRYTFELERRRLHPCLRRRAARPRCRAGTAGTGIRTRRPRQRRCSRSRGVAAHRRSRPGHGVHGQSRDRAEHPDLALADSGRRASGSADVRHDGDGGHRTHAVRHGDLRIADDAANGAAARACGRHGARDADRPGRLALADRRNGLVAQNGRIVVGRRPIAVVRRADEGPGVVRDDPSAPPVDPRDRWKIRGTAVKKIDGRDFVTGRHQYTPDVVRPDMLHGRIVRPDGYGATLASVDDSRARSMPGVSVVRDGDFLGVVAPTERAAIRAASADPGVVADGRPASRPPRRCSTSSRRIRNARAVAGMRRSLTGDVEPRHGGARVTSTRAIAFPTSRTFRSSRAPPSRSGTTAS